jgi:drug/metabolite transporter (DMT)-like permease
VPVTTTSHARIADDRALAAMLLGAALIGTNGLMVRFADAPPTVSAFWRMAFAGLALAIAVAVARRWRTMPARAWAWSALPAAAFAADLWLWHRSILLVGPGLATLLANAQVFFMALAGALLFRERLGPRFLAGIALAFLGLWLLLGRDWPQLAPEYRWGVWLGLGTGVCYAAYNIGLRTAQRAASNGAGGEVPLAQVLGVVSLGSALLLGLFGAMEGVSFAIPGAASLGWLLTLALVGHCLSWLLISRAMQRLPVALVGLLLLLQPIVAFLLDVLVLGRDTAPREWLGLAVSLAGIFVAGLKGRERLPEAAG